MTNFTKHVGTNHLGTKVVIVFRELPEDEDSCLVVETKTLPEMYHDQLMRVVDSQEGQSVLNLYEVLQRRMFGDGRPMLQGLHERGLLKKMSVDQISVVPMPNRSAPLRDINKQISGSQSPGDVAETTTPVELPNTQASAEAPVADQPPVGSDEQKSSLAETKLLTARLMEEDAKKLREEAYTLDPSLKKGGRPSKAQKEKAEGISAD